MCRVQTHVCAGHSNCVDMCRQAYRDGLRWVATDQNDHCTASCTCAELFRTLQKWQWPTLHVPLLIQEAGWDTAQVMSQHSCVSTSRHSAADTRGKWNSRVGKNHARMLVITHVLDRLAAVLSNRAVLHSIRVRVPVEAAVGRGIALPVVGVAGEELVEGPAVAAHGFLHMGHGMAEGQHWMLWCSH